MALCRSGLLAALLAVAALHASDARAGIRPYIWTWDTQTVAQGDVELEQWLWVRGKIDPVRFDPATTVPSRDSAYWLWFGPVIGATQHLELAFPFQTVGNAGGFFLESFEVDARYRFFSRNDDGKLQPMVRAAFHQAIRSAAVYSRVEADAVLSYGSPSEFQAAANVGTRVSLPFLSWSSAPPRVQVTYAAGASYPFTDWFRAGAEVFGELDVANYPPDTDLPHHFVGVNASWKFGRIWLTAGTLVGLTPLFPSTPQFMPRLIWAVAL
jgi:hypothetical protein